MTDKEREWVETNNAVCALLKQAHDVLALTSLPPRREWVGLTEEEKYDCYLKIDVWSRCVEAIEAKLKEKNT